MINVLALYLVPWNATKELSNVMKYILIMRIMSITLTISYSHVGFESSTNKTLIPCKSLAYEIQIRHSLVHNLEFLVDCSQNSSTNSIVPMLNA